MKRSLGNLWIAMIVIPTCGWGVTYHWQLLNSPHTLRVDQSALVRYECRFDDTASDYTIKLHPVDTAEYTLTILREQNRVEKGKRIDTFDLVLTPKQSGVLPVRMEGVVESVPPGAIGYNAHLGRDNVSKSDVVSTRITLPFFTFESKPNDAELTGKMTLEASADKTLVRGFEPLHLSIVLKGVGNLEKLVPFDVNISGVRVFSEPPQKQLSPTPEGEIGEIRQEFALVAQESYEIPPFSLKVFDTQTQRMNVLKTAPIHVEIAEGYEAASLLDPPDLNDRSTLIKISLYGALVLLGVVLGEVGRRIGRLWPKRRPELFWERAETAQELVTLLALSGEKRYESVIDGLESGTFGLREAKAKLAKLTKDKEVQR